MPDEASKPHDFFKDIKRFIEEHTKDLDDIDKVEFSSLVFDIAATDTMIRFVTVIPESTKDAQKNRLKTVELALTTKVLKLAKIVEKAIVDEEHN